ncbi:MAG: GGDEF domain-containing protein [Lysobacter sp.]|nr:GGDEF domain-containing protein [Lysobacter sp.]
MDDSKDLQEAGHRGLLKRFAILSAVSVVAILLLVGVGVHAIYRNQVIEAAQGNAVAVAQALFAQEKRVLVQTSAAGNRIALSQDDFTGLDQRMRAFLAPFGIVKIKVYDGGSKVAYSTDASIIGQVDANNPKLERVLRTGELDSKLVKKEKVADLHGKDRFLVDVVETYVPVRVGGEIVGSFEVYLDVSPAYERIIVALQLSLAVLLSVLVLVFTALYVPMRQGTLGLERVQKRLAELAATDLLTGLFNRRHLFTRIGEEYRRMARDRRSVTRVDRIGFIMADIDHFKSINDSHGHLGGDEVLRQASNRLKASLRAYDVIGRYGGEEFLVMLPHTGIEAAKAVAERMRLAIRETPIYLDGKALQVTASFGVSESSDADEDEEKALQRADEGMYRAKEGGRDRVASVA